MAGGCLPERVILHVDMDAFYASIEQLENPAWRGKPLIVGGVRSARGVVSSASYEARRFGVRSAMPVSRARRLCPGAIFVPDRHALYGEYSARLMALLDGFSPSVEPVSVDEAFLDMTGALGLWGGAEAAGRCLQTVIRRELGLTASIGIAPNKYLAKLASDWKKPMGLTLIAGHGVREFLDPLPVERLWGVGEKTRPVLERAGLRTIGQVRRHPLRELRRLLGPRTAEHVYALARGVDEREVGPQGREKSISHETTFERDCADGEMLEAVLLELCDKVARRARRLGLGGCTVSVVWRDPDFSRHSRSRTLPVPTCSGSGIHAAASDLLRGVVCGPEARRSFRLLGVRLSRFAEESPQLSFLHSPAPRHAVDVALDAVKDRFGDAAIKRGRLLG